MGKLGADFKLFSPAEPKDSPGWMLLRALMLSASDRSSWEINSRAVAALHQALVQVCKEAKTMQFIWAAQVTGL
jgi:hypothetical protein